MLVCFWEWPGRLLASADGKVSRVNPLLRCPCPPHLGPGPGPQPLPRLDGGEVPGPQVEEALQGGPAFALEIENLRW